MKIRRRWLYDAGVKGMKKGQHVKAKDPEYLARIKNAGKYTLGGAGLMAAGGAVGSAIEGGGLKGIPSGLKTAGKQVMGSKLLKGMAIAKSEIKV